MIVLSLFDGIAVARQSLKDAGIEITKYYACEMDAKARQVAIANHPDIDYLGYDVNDLDVKDLKVDLLIGGFSCQSFSRAGRRLGFDDPRGVLFWQYKRIKEELQVNNPNLRFIAENVVMKPEYEKIISEALGVEPTLINSSGFTPQNRKRLYWTNIDIRDYKNKNLKILDILEESDYHQWYELENYSEKLQKRILSRIKNLGDKALNVCCNSRSVGANGATLLRADTKIRCLTRLEIERLQGLPDNYTKAIAKSPAIKTLGNSFTAPVISHILKSQYGQ